jgi:outer membrane protein assembly factor BamB
MNESRKMKVNLTGDMNLAICIILLIILGIGHVSADTGTIAPAEPAITPASMYSMVETNPDLQQGVLPDGFVLLEQLPGWKYHSDLKNSGVYDDGGWRPNGLELWNVSDVTGSDISMVESSPAVADGVVYVTDRGDPGHLFAINAKTGAIKWENTLLDGSWTSPAVANGMVYVGTGWPGSDTPGTFYAFNASTGGGGTPVWSKTLPYGPVGSSPAVAYGNVYVGRGDHNVSAWNATTGAVVWTFPTSTEVYSSPAVYNGNVYFSTPDESGGGNIFAVNAITGAKVWDAKNASGYGIGGTFDDAGAVLGSSPAVADGVLYIGGYSGVFAFDANTGAQLREFNDTVGSYYFSTPAVANGLVYFGTSGASPHHFYALNANDFSVNWSNTTPDDTDMDSSPAVANGVVYVTSDRENNFTKGFLYAWNANTGAPIWKFLPVGAGGTSSGPAVANGVVYFGTWWNGLYAVGTEHTTSAGRIGVVRNNNTWLLDKSGNGAYGAGDLAYTFGKAADKYVTGAW